MTIGGKIKQLRKEKGLTQEELAKMLGVSQAMVNQYENHQREPKTLALIKKIAFVLDVSPCILIGFEKSFCKNNQNINPEKIRQHKEDIYAERGKDYASLTTRYSIRKERVIAEQKKAIRKGYDIDKAEILAEIAEEFSEALFDNQNPAETHRYADEYICTARDGVGPIEPIMEKYDAIENPERIITEFRIFLRHKKMGEWGIHCLHGYARDFIEYMQEKKYSQEIIEKTHEVLLQEIAKGCKHAMDEYEKNGKAALKKLSLYFDCNYILQTLAYYYDEISP